MPQITIPSPKVPSGTVYNDIVTLVIAVVAILKALGVL